MEYEENAYERAEIAAEWIRAVEAGAGPNDELIYPRLTEWLQRINPGTVVDIGCGQGICATRLGNDAINYIGVEPSVPLVEKAKECYQKDNRQFLIGNAYALPIADAVADAAFALMMWFHLADLGKASRELSRILKPSGRFMIFTINPDAHDIWKTFFLGAEQHGNAIFGKFYLPRKATAQGSAKFCRISRSKFFLHSLEDIIGHLKQSNLAIDEVAKVELPSTFKSYSKPIYVDIRGYKL